MTASVNGFFWTDRNVRLVFADVQDEQLSSITAEEEIILRERDVGLNDEIIGYVIDESVRCESVSFIW